MIAVLILLMVVSIVGAAIPTASSVYTKAVDTANAQVLLSTAMTVLRDELGNATEVDISSNKKTIQYRSGNNGRISKVFYSSADFSVTDSDGDTRSFTKGVYIWEYGVESITHDAETGDPVKTVAFKTKFLRPLVTGKAATRGLNLTFSNASEADHVITIGSLTVDREGGSTALAQKLDYSIRTLG